MYLHECVRVIPGPLFESMTLWKTSQTSEGSSSSKSLVDVVHSTFSLPSAVNMMEVLLHSCHKIVLEAAFDDLVKDIWCNQLMNVSMRKVISKRLNFHKSGKHCSKQMNNTTIDPTIPKSRRRTSDVSSSKRASLYASHQHSASSSFSFPRGARHL
jgi:hypothetical protein